MRKEKDRKKRGRENQRGERRETRGENLEERASGRNTAASAPTFVNDALAKYLQNGGREINTPKINEKKSAA